MEARGVRIGWADVPWRVRSAIEDGLGAPVVEAVSQPGGFSPGSADRVVLADGRRAFIKAVGLDINPHSPALHRREIAIAGALPPNTPAPGLLASYDDGDWVALAFEDVDGRQPATPWVETELAGVFAALRRLQHAMTPSPIDDAVRAIDDLGPDLLSWSRLRDDPPDNLDPWAREHLDQLCELGELGRASLGGDTLVHMDIRADNLLLRADGGVAFVDWPWACIGPGWLDTLLLLVNVAYYGGHDTEALLRRELPDVDPDAVTGVLAGLSGFFLDAARQPSSPGLPTVREFQRTQGVSTLAWVRQRLERPTPYA